MWVSGWPCKGCKATLCKSATGNFSNCHSIALPLLSGSQEAFDPLIRGRHVHFHPGVGLYPRVHDWLRHQTLNLDLSPWGQGGRPFSVAKPLSRTRGLYATLPRSSSTHQRDAARKGTYCRTWSLAWPHTKPRFPSVLATDIGVLKSFALRRKKKVVGREMPERWGWILHFLRNDPTKS